MSAVGPLERRARSQARYWLLQGMAAAGDALPPLIAEAEALAAGIATGRAAGQAHDAQMAAKVLRTAYDTGKLPEALS
jgi:hypothetical protein